jgi:hypothetical protein
VISFPCIAKNMFRRPRSLRQAAGLQFVANGASAYRSLKLDV